MEDDQSTPNKTDLDSTVKNKIVRRRSAPLFQSQDILHTEVEESENALEATSNSTCPAFGFRDRGNDSCFQSGSNAYTDPVCSRCSDGRRTEVRKAKSYCVGCNVYLCSRCYRHHPKNDPHRFLKGDNMPGSLTVNRMKMGKFKTKALSINVSESPDPIVVDEQPGSKVTVKRSHSQDEILTKTSGIYINRKLSETVHTMLKDAICLHEHMQKSHKQLEEKKNSTLGQIEVFAKGLIDIINRFKSDLVNQLNDEYKTRSEALETKQKECKHLISRLSTDAQTLGEPKTKLNSTSKIKEIQLRCSLKYKKCYDRLCQHTENKELNFQQNDRLATEIERSKCIGVLSCDSTDTFTFNHHKHLSGNEETRISNTKDIATTREKDAVHSSDSIFEGSESFSKVGEFSSWISGDFETPLISGMEVIDENGLLLVDQSNKRLKLFKVLPDIRCEPVTHIELDYEPYGVAKVNQTSDEVLVTLPVHHSVQRVDVTGSKINLEEIINVGIECTGIIVVNGKAFITGYNHEVSELLTLDIETKVVTLLYRSTKADTIQILKRPNYLCKDSDGKNIFITDADSGVLGVKTDELDDACITFLYNDKTLKCPLGCTMDAFDRLYVCGLHSHAIHRLSVRGDSTEERQYSLTTGFRNPQCIVYVKTLNEFFVSWENSADIMQYKLQ